ncbi:hypothetical protein F5Y16DRAFT_376834 [Xylariaceae sp. FL0255]|nr:hypothetical protein F5Y16DRAFT_376834 [Xylariaceae sp. FL0255]
MESISPYQSTTYPCKSTGRVKRDDHQTDRSTSIIKSLQLGQAWYSIALVGVEILFLVEWIASMMSTSSQMSSRLRTEHILTLLTGLFSNVCLIIWHTGIYSSFRGWKKTPLVVIISSVIWSSLTIYVVYACFGID